MVTVKSQQNQYQVSYVLVDCEQSLLFPPVIVYRARKRSAEARGLRFRSVSALGTITGGKRRDCLQSNVLG